MLKTIDEILIKYATFLDDWPIPAPEPPKPGELTVVPAKPPAPGPKIKLPTPIPLPKDIERPISKRDVEKPKWPKGSPEDIAENHTFEFLTETQHPYRGWRTDPELKGLVAKTMDKLVEEHPEDYFKWKLNMKLELQDWLYRAAENLIDRDPDKALYLRIYRFPELEETKRDMKFAGMKMRATLNAKLFWNVKDKYVREAGKNNQEVFDQMTFRKMRQLCGVLAKTDPEFYRLFVRHLPVATKRFNLQSDRVRGPDSGDFDIDIVDEE